MTENRWPDLRQRLLSALVLAGLGITAVILGGLPFAAFIAALTGVMVWELARIATGNAGYAFGLAIVSGLLLFFEPGGYQIALTVLILGIPLIISMLATDHKLQVGLFAVMVAASGFVMEILRFDLGLVWVLWLVLVVIATDVAGYFAGRTFGGPKFWPSISPKKTWSGVIAGWIAAALVGVIFDGGNLGVLAVLSMLVSFASQMGDIAESSVKRRFAVKDSSNLIPGHGGFLDRFDAMIAATLLLGVLNLILPDGLHFFDMAWQ